MLNVDLMVDMFIYLICKDGGEGGCKGRDWRRFKGRLERSLRESSEEIYEGILIKQQEKCTRD